MSEATNSNHREIKTYLRTLRLELDKEYLIDRIILEDGYWELHVILYLQRFIKPGWVCVDVGANAGYITLPMAERAGISGKVLAFEPNPNIKDKFLRNVKLNPDNIAPIELFPYGLGAEEGSFFLSEALGSGYGNAVVYEKENKGSKKIKVVTLDSLSLDRMDFIKIDVEGMELSVLQGALKTIERCRPIVLFETLTSLKPEKHKPCEDLLRSQDYICYALDLQRERLQEISYPNYPQEDTIAIPIEMVKDI